MPPAPVPPSRVGPSRVVQAARIVRAARHAWNGRLPPPGERVPPGAEAAPQANRRPEPGSPKAGRLQSAAPESLRTAVATPPADVRRRPSPAPGSSRPLTRVSGARPGPRVGRVAARVGWALAAVGLAVLGVLELGVSFRIATVLSARGGGFSTVLAPLLAIVVLTLGGIFCLACSPLCAPRAVGRRPTAGRSRLPGLLLAAELTARILAGVCLIAAAIESHESAKLWFTRGPGSGALLTRIAVHPASLIVTAVAAAALSLRWSRLVRAAHRTRA